MQDLFNAATATWTKAPNAIQETAVYADPKRAAHLSHMLEQLKELQQLPEVPVETLK